LISTALLLTFILTCNPNISTMGVYRLTHSLFSGAILCGGMGILRNSFFRTVLVDEAGRGVKPDEEGRASGAADMQGKTDVEVEDVGIKMVSSSSSSTSIEVSWEVEGPALG
jgi:hypothetical protein